MTVTVSAPGKLMLFGEHAVVYGRPCIVTAIDQRMRATATLTSEPFLELDAPDVGVVRYRKAITLLGAGEVPKGARFAEHAVKNVSILRGYTGGVRISTSSDFHAQFGFGSSSASTVCIVGAFLELLDGRTDKKQVFDIAYQTVLAVQGKGSGFDVAAAIWGGTLLFVSPGTTIEPLTIDALPLIIGYTGIKADTVSIVNAVLEDTKKNPDHVNALYDAMGECAKRAEPMIRNADWSGCGLLMNENQRLLADLGVSSTVLDALIDAANQAGAYGAKLSGAGKGDCMIALAPEEKRLQVMHAILAVGGQVIDIASHAEGLRGESHSA